MNALNVYKKSLKPSLVMPTKESMPSINRDDRRRLVFNMPRYFRLHYSCRTLRNELIGVGKKLPKIGRYEGGKKLTGIFGELKKIERAYNLAHA